MLGKVLLIGLFLHLTEATNIKVQQIDRHTVNSSEDSHTLIVYPSGSRLNCEMVEVCFRETSLSLNYSNSSLSLSSKRMHPGVNGYAILGKRKVIPLPHQHKRSKPWLQNSNFVLKLEVKAVLWFIVWGKVGVLGVRNKKPSVPPPHPQPHCTQGPKVAFSSHTSFSGYVQFRGSCRFQVSAAFDQNFFSPSCGDFA